MNTLQTPLEVAAKGCYSGSTLTPIRPSAMATTSLKLSDELKQRAAAAAEQLGISPHAFMVDAIRSATDKAEQRGAFVAQAQAARKEMLRSGSGVDADAARAYLRQRVADQTATAPEPTSWQK